MKIFFDNCISPVIATTIHGFIAHRAQAAVHIKDLPCGRDAADVTWMTYLKESGGDWLIFTGDLRIQRNRAERLAFRQAVLKGIVLAPAYQRLAIHQQASFLLWRWPDVESITRLTAAPFLFELPATRSSRMRQLAI